MRRPLIVLLAVIAVLLIAHGLVWGWAERQLQFGFEAWAQARRTEGWVVAHEPTRWAGWPLQAELDVPGMSLSGSGAPAEWQAGRVVLSVAPTEPGTLSIAFPDQQRVTLAGLAPVGFAAGRMVVVTPLDPAAGQGLDLDVRDLHATLPSGELTAARLQIHADPTQHVTLSAGDLALPPQPGATPGHDWPLGRRLASVVVDATIVGALPQAAGGRAQAVAWRDAGGMIRLTHFALGWGPLGVTATGQIRLDAQLQPAMQADLHVVGADATLDALAASGMLTARAAGAAKAVLGLIAHIPNGGGAPVLDAPLTIQGGQVAVGHIPLARIPELDWSAIR